MKTISIAILKGLFLLGLAGSAFAQNHARLNNNNAYPAPCEESVRCSQGTCYGQIHLWSFDENGLPIETRIHDRTVSKNDKLSENRAEAQKLTNKRLEQLKNLGVCR